MKESRHIHHHGCLIKGEFLYVLSFCFCVGTAGHEHYKGNQKDVIILPLQCKPTTSPFDSAQGKQSLERNAFQCNPFP